MGARQTIQELKEMDFGGVTGLTGAERMNIYNLARRSQAGATKQATESMTASMGGRGFKAGESGIADSAIGQIQQAGAEKMGSLASELAANEAKLRGDQRLQESQLGLTALSAAGGIEGQLAQASAAGSAARMQAKLGQDRLAWDKEKYKEYQFPMQQQDAAWSNMFSMYGMMGNQQNQDYNRYASMLSGA